MLHKRRVRDKKVQVSRISQDVNRSLATAERALLSRASEKADRSAGEDDKIAFMRTGLHAHT